MTDKAPQLVLKPWTKFCLKGSEANAQRVCFTGTDARLESGKPVVSAVIVEPEGESKKVLRVTLPLGMSLRHGARVAIDGGQPTSRPYVICYASGCIVDHDADAEWIGRLKNGERLIVQAVDGNGRLVSYSLRLAGFAAAHDGPPTDLAVFEEQQKLLQEKTYRLDDRLIICEGAVGAAACVVKRFYQ